MNAAMTVSLPALAQNDGNEQLNTDVTVTVTNTANSQLSHTSRSANTPVARKTTPAAHGTAEVGGTTGNVDNPTNKDPTIDANTTLRDGRARIDCDGRAWFDVELAAAARPFPSKKNSSRTFSNHNGDNTPNHPLIHVPMHTLVKKK